MTRETQAKAESSARQPAGAVHRPGVVVLSDNSLSFDASENLFPKRYLATSMPGARRADRRDVVPCAHRRVARPGVAHDAAVVGQRTDQRMLFQPGQRELFGGVTFEQFADDAKPEFPVRKCDFTGFFQRVAVMLLGQRCVTSKLG